jgi:hypothetical protein
LPRYSTDLPAHLSRECFKNAFQVGRRIPQGLKPSFLLAHGGTAEAVPYPKPIFETRSNNPKTRQAASLQRTAQVGCFAGQSFLPYWHLYLCARRLSRIARSDRMFQIACFRWHMRRTKQCEDCGLLSCY